MALAFNVGCPICHNKVILLHCRKCNVMPYCSEECQKSDWNNHKASCRDVKRSRKSYLIEKNEFHRFIHNLYEDHEADFESIVNVPYMGARYALVVDLLKIKTFDAVQEAFDHIKDMIRPCRGNGLQFLAPALYLRLNRDQECYDFLRWWTTTGNKPDYNWENMKLPYLDTKNANAFEPIDIFIDQNSEISYCLALFLIKLKLLNDLKTLMHSEFLYDRLPIEIVDLIRTYLVNEIVANKKDIMRDQNYSTYMAKLELELKEIYSFINTSNKYVWPGVLNPETYLNTYVMKFRDGTKEHACKLVQHYYDAFVETFGAIDTIKEMVQNK